MWSLLAISTASMRSLFFADSSCNSNDHTSTVTRTRWWVAIIHGDEERRPFLCFWVQSTLFSFIFYVLSRIFILIGQTYFFVSISLFLLCFLFLSVSCSLDNLWKKNNRNAEKKIQYECIYDFVWIEVQWWKRKPFDQISSQIFMQNIRAFSITHFTKNIKRCRITFLKQVTSPGQTGSGTRSATVAYSPAIRESLF